MTDSEGPPGKGPRTSDLGADEPRTSDLEARPPSEPSTVEASTVEASTVEASTVEASTVEAPTVEASTVEAPTVEASTVEASTVEASTVEAVPVTGAGAGAGGDDAILPPAFDEAALRDAVGAAPMRRARRDRDDDGDDGAAKPGNRRLLAALVLAILFGLGITTFVLLGRVNAERYVIACATDQVSAEQGRAFPPWGTKPLLGAEWKPITLPANAECRPRETDDRAELERWFLELLIDRASTTLTARNLLDSIQPGKSNPLDLVAAQLNQALLLSRAPERRDQRKDVERLLGDVQYWRASLRLRDAAAALADAAGQFDAAAAQRPRHVTDAGEWATYLRKVVDDLRAGPAGVPALITPTGEPVGERPIAPAGTALPVEPEGAAEVAPPPDAGLPTGGVLL